MADSFEDVLPGSQLVDGLQVPAPFKPENVRSAMKYQPQPDDVFIVTYPKCGTTWAQHIVLLIFRGGVPVDKHIEFLSLSPFLEVTGAAAAETMSKPGVIKFHLPFHVAPWSDRAKYTYVARNPKDCCVSYFHHASYHAFKGNFDEFFEIFLRGKTDFGDYFDHLMGWYEHRNASNVLFLTYEEMKEDIEGAILKMASFLDDEKYAEPLRKDPSILQKIIKYSSFEYMKETVNSSMAVFSKEDVVDSQLPEDTKKLYTDFLDRHQAKEVNKVKRREFIRKGIVGDWRNYFSQDQSRRLEQKLTERAGNTDIVNFWIKYME